MNKFSKFLTLSATLLSIGLASSSAAFGKLNASDDQLSMWKGLIEDHLSPAVDNTIKNASEMLNNYRGKVSGTTVTFPTLDGVVMSSIGEINFTGKDGLGKTPPVTIFGVFNLLGSDTSALSAITDSTIIYDSTPSALDATPAATNRYSTMIYQINKTETNNLVNDKDYVIVVLNHGKVTDVNVAESLTFPPTSSKCYTNTVDLQDMANFTGDNSAAGLYGKVKLNDGKIMDIKNVSPYLANCIRADINVTFAVANATSLTSTSAPAWKNHGSTTTGAVAQVTSVTIDPTSN